MLVGLKYVIIIVMKKSVIGILAHVDAGKTTLIESMLYKAGTIRTLGRVDNRDAFLDYDSQERNRGITIYAKQADFNYRDCQFMILDTPGHADFSSEMERTLNVVDGVILLINGQDGVQSHTETIWELLDHYQIPVYIFVNKMDISYLSKQQLLSDIQKKLSANCFDVDDSAYLESVSLTDEEMMEQYLQDEDIEQDLLIENHETRNFFPVVFGSALKNDNVDCLMDIIEQYSPERIYPEEFGAIVYKISSDEDGNRLTHLKVTGGSLKAKQKLTEDEKVDQIRIYNGVKYTMVDEASAGTICTIKGLKTIEAGQGFGFEANSEPPLLNGYMNYQVLLPAGVDAIVMMQYLTKLASEDPQLQVSFNETSKQIYIRLMGDIQIEILKNTIFQRSGVHVEFGPGKIIYKETISNTVEGVGHFEPLRHYAEVHLRLEPGKPNSGLIFDSECSTDDLSLNWQRLILTHLKEKTHRGVLTGSPITDMKITLTAGKAHQKHTEGGDFRQATYRAVRQGLKMAESVLLEPFYRFEILVESPYLSRVLYDLESRKAAVQIDNKDELMRITGRGPVRLMQNYNRELLASTKGKGKITLQLDGYYPCLDQQEIVESIGYDSELDMRNPTGSVFCAHGSGFYVPYDQVREYMHIQISQQVKQESISEHNRYSVDDEELKRVVGMINGRNKKQKKFVSKKKNEYSQKAVSLRERKPKCLLVDGYNIIFSWKMFEGMLDNNIEAARDRLIHEMNTYAGMKGVELILVFDAYKVKDNGGRMYQDGAITIVYTKAGQTADSYIEKATSQLRNKYDILVASSDAAVQNIVLGNDALRISARELESEMESIHLLTSQRVKQESKAGNRLLEELKNIKWPQDETTEKSTGSN